MLGDLDACRFERLDLVRGTASVAFDDGSGVPHAFSGRGGLPGDERDDRLGHLGGNEFRGFVFVGAADLANQHHLFSMRIMLEHFETVDEVRAVNGVAADAHASGGAHADQFQRIKHFIGQRAGAGDHTDITGDGDVTGDDADL